MLKANELIILSYINKFQRIDLYEIQKTINEPLVQLMDSIYRLYENKYIVNDGIDKFSVTEKAKEENIGSWNIWTLKYKEKNINNNVFKYNKKYTGEFCDNGVPKISSVHQINDILELNHIDIESYHGFVLSYGGKNRMILAPGLNLKERQKWILHNILEKIPVEDCAHGFVKGRSIKTNAEVHVNKKEIVCLDIKDFFPSIKRVQVENVFLELNYSEEVAKKISSLVTYNDELPQGAPTSPYLSNLVFRNVDMGLKKLAKENDLEYTRYADDITFSANHSIDNIIKEAEEIIERAGFIVNEDKTHIMKDNYRKMVTGLVVNHKVRIPSAYKKKFRQEIYYCKKYGVSQHLRAIGRENAVNFQEYMYGKAYYIKMIEKELGEKLLLQLDSIFGV
ncbi:retron-type RNA-directed DNA polymerase [Lachnospiraceae bacterium KM106-2]|nr:retron-type RNA-directed DNA polymerase [Lachnospiraceae bacterium KM106-2]